MATRHVTLPRIDCLVRGCTLRRIRNGKPTPLTRGLCLSHYRTVHRHVQEGKTTWQELEAAGRVLPMICEPHQQTHTRLYGIWRGMMIRCYDTNRKAYRWYGAKGIRVYKLWHKFTVFAAWARSHGYQDDLTIDRRDTTKNYCPENCLWVTRAENSRSQNNVIYLTAFGETKTLAEWLRDPRCVVRSKSTLWARALWGWDGEYAITTPADRHRTRNAGGVGSTAPRQTPGTVHRRIELVRQPVERRRIQTAGTRSA